MTSKTPDSADAIPLRDMVFGPAYRLSIVMEPSGVIRDVIEVAAVRDWDLRSFKGRHVADVAHEGVRGEWRRALWLDRVEAVQRAHGPLLFMDHRPDQPLDQTPLVEYTLSPIRTADGQLESLFLQIIDQTDRWDAAELARAQREQLANALELTGLGSYTAYFREPRFDASQRFREIYGIDPQCRMEAEGMDGFWRMVHPDDEAKARAALQSAIDGDGEYVSHYRLCAERPDGPQLRWIEALGRVEQDHRGPVRVLGVIEDVTDRRREEEARMGQQKREAIGTLAGGVAHDFNNVISAIVSNAALAERELAGQQPAALMSVREIARAASRAADLVKRLLLFSREDAPREDAFDLAAVVDEAAALLRPTLPANIDLDVAVGPALPPAFGDSSQLHQVLVNLIANAGDAIAGGGGRGRIEVHLEAVDLQGTEAPRAPGTHLRLRVCDDGPGVSERIAQQIFDPFFTTKPVGQGTGLGLTAAQTIVSRHGGQITIDSAPGRGAVFTILLPVAPAGQGPGAPADPAPARRGGPWTMRVLFVDDEPALTRLAERALPAYRCLIAAFTDPHAALVALQEAPTDFDVLITDLAMPGMDGLQLTAAARQIQPELPVVLSSGYLTAESRAEAHRQGVGVVVPKPTSIDALVKAARSLVSEPSSSEAGEG